MIWSVMNPNWLLDCKYSESNSLVLVTVVLALCERNRRPHRAGTTKPSLWVHYYSLCLSVFVLSSGSEAPSPFVARLLVAPIIREEGRDASGSAASHSGTSLCCTCSPAAATFKEAKVVFCLPLGREEVGCFRLVVWYPKKASSMWCLIIVMTGAGPPKTFWLYPRLHDWTKHNSDPDTIAYSHIWFDISLLFQPCDVLSSLAWKDLTAGYFFKVFLHNKPQRCQLSMLLNVMCL